MIKPAVTCHQDELIDLLVKAHVSYVDNDYTYPSYDEDGASSEVYISKTIVLKCYRDSEDRDSAAKAQEVAAFYDLAPKVHETNIDLKDYGFINPKSGSPYRFRYGYVSEIAEGEAASESVVEVSSEAIVAFRKKLFKIFFPYIGKGFDLAFLGDMHKNNVFVKECGKLILIDFHCINQSPGYVCFNGWETWSRDTPDWFKEKWLLA